MCQNLLDMEVQRLIRYSKKIRNFGGIWLVDSMNPIYWSLELWERRKGKQQMCGNLTDYQIHLFHFIENEIGFMYTSVISWRNSLSHLTIVNPAVYERPLDWLRSNPLGSSCENLSELSTWYLIKYVFAIEGHIAIVWNCEHNIQCFKTCEIKFDVSLSFLWEDTINHKHFPSLTEEICA